MRILITGARGRMGRLLAERWANHELTLLDREDGDLRYRGSWERSFDDIDTVVHLAGHVASPLGPFEENGPDNILMTLNIIRASTAARRIVFASSVWAAPEIYDRPRTTYYGASKQAGEAFLRAWAETERRTAVALRCGLYAPHERPVSRRDMEILRVTDAALFYWFNRALEASETGFMAWSAVGDLYGGATMIGP